MSIVALAMVLGLAVSGCGGGGESEADRAEVVQMLERLGRGRNLSQCMADRFDGGVSVEELQTVIDARGDMTLVNFELVETITVALAACSEDDG